jgi:hypothetical protein
MHELLPPQVHDMNDTYEKEFVGMTTRDVGVDELEETRERLFAELPLSLDEAERKFLHSVHRLDPEWDLVGVQGIENLPALRWKLLNLERLKAKNQQKFDAMLEALCQQLNLG